MAEESTEQKPAAEAETFHRDRLLAESGTLFGQPPHVLAGALSQGRLANKVNFTIDEVKKAIKDFHDHEVEIDHPHSEREE